MEQGLYPFLLHWLQILWWPFARIMALLAFAPIFGDPTVPVRVRVTIALTLAVVALPSVSSAVISVNAFSLTAVALTLEQIAIGAVLGLALQFATTALSIFGFLSASQTSLAMAMLNDPVNGSSSDALSVLALLLGMLLFFVLDIHLLVAGIVSASFDAWPVGQSLNRLQLQTVAYNMGWVFAAAFLLATPIANGLRRTPIDRGRNDVAGLDRLLATLAGPSRAVGVALVGVLAVLWVMLAPGAIAAAPVRANTPEKALAAFQATGIKANVLNAYGFGGYLIYRQVPVFIDGRADMYGDPFVTAAADAVMLQSPGALEKLIERYHVGWTLLGPQSPAVELLDHLPQWERVYSDSVAVLHIRRDLLHPTPTTR